LSEEFSEESFTELLIIMPELSILFFCALAGEEVGVFVRNAYRTNTSNITPTTAEAARKIFIYYVQYSSWQINFLPGREIPCPRFSHLNID